MPSEPTALALTGVSVWVPNGPTLLSDVSWAVHPGEHWLVLGHNGAGKTTLLSVAGATRHPSAGTVEILGRRLGQVDVRELRAELGAVDSTLQDRFGDWLPCFDIVLTGASGTVAPLWQRYTATDRERAEELMDLLGCADLRAQRYGTCSLGERQRLVLARALMARPKLLLLDEPMSGLDLPAREALLAALAALAAAEPDLATVLVTHHLEEVPRSTTHALLLGRGHVLANGPVETALTSASVSDTFGIPVEVHRRDGRWSAVAPPSWNRLATGTPTAIH